MKTVYFIRHGETLYNAEGKYIGATDLGLTARGSAEVSKKWSGRGGDIEKDILYSSPMKRCLETAAIIFPDDTPVIIDNLREMNFGIFEGVDYRELERNPVYKEFIKKRGMVKIPDGESGQEFGRRVLKGFFKIIKDMEAKGAERAAVICHGGVIMGLFSVLCNDSSDIYHYHVHNACGYKTVYDKKLKKLKISEKI
ncbi:MAG: histidine phosphatase family protein [Mucispirillum sp.]|nr:histidine phosphatase family protein [Mucispirillum sp.]